MNALIPRIMVGGTVLVLYAAYSFMPQGNVAGMDLDSFGRLPIMDQGRIKPIDTLCRNSLVVMTGGKTTYVDADGNSQPATKWLLETITVPFSRNHAIYGAKVFRIENDQVLQLLKLEPRSGLRYSWEEISPRYRQLMAQAFQAQKRRKAKLDLDVYQAKVLEVAGHLRPAEKLEHLIPQSKEDLEPDDEESQLQVIPLANGKGEWVTLADAIVSDNQVKDPAVTAFGKILIAYAQNDASGFNDAVAKYREVIAPRIPASAISTASFETTFNEASLFYSCMWLYIAIFLVTCAGWALSDNPTGRFCTQAAFTLVVVAVTIHSFALISRMWIQGRPPVTNLYSSAVFIGWGCVLLGLVIETIIGMGIGNALATVMGALTLFIANFLAQGGDTMEMLEAVLDTNFWLATHVVCVTLGYTATFVAGFLGIFYIVWGTATPFMSRPLAKGLWQVMYGVVCFATLLSFVGTVLGGIWADQSWGRFWGWDPKENGAVLIVIWNALILHARWGGMVKERGMAVLTVAGNMVTAWSWFGTNQLGVGLHAYGFNNTLATALMVFWLSQLAIMGVGLTPLKYWWSFRVPNEIEVIDPNPVGEPRPRRRPRLA